MVNDHSDSERGKPLPSQLSDSASDTWLRTTQIVRGNPTATTWATLFD